MSVHSSINITKAEVGTRVWDVVMMAWPCFCLNVDLVALDLESCGML